ncbi:MAG: hypothetical protein R6X29_05635 [Acidimicrobiia bacterium]|jgi:hypothetical protein
MGPVGIPLAVYDLVPVAVAGLALGLITAAVGRRYRPARMVAAIGTAFVVGGGGLKAGSKLVAAAGDGIPPPLLDAALFPLIAPGMVMLALAVAATRAAPGIRRLLPALPVVVPAGVWTFAAVLAAGPGWDTAEVMLIVVATAGNVALGGLLIRWSLVVGLRWAAALFAVNLVVVIGMAGLTRGVDQTIGWQWIEQTINLGAQLAFLLGAHRLARATEDVFV